MSSRPRAEPRSGSVVARLVPTALSVALAFGAVTFAREFRADAVREFRFAWDTWAAALLLAFGAGGLAASAVGARIGRGVAAIALLGSAAVLAHLPVVLLGAGRLGWDVLATTSFVDRTGPQLLAAAVAGGAVAAWRPASARRGRVQPVQ